MSSRYRPGEDNPMTRHSDDAVRRARLIFSRGYTQQETRQHLADEGIEVGPLSEAVARRFRRR